MKSSTYNVSLLEMPELAGLISSTLVVEHAAGEALFQSGEPCISLPLLKSGNATIYARDKTGRQVTLYCLKPGDVCPIALSTLLQRSTYPVTAIAGRNRRTGPLPVRQETGSDHQQDT